MCKFKSLNLAEINVVWKYKCKTANLWGLDLEYVQIRKWNKEQREAVRGSSERQWNGEKEIRLAEGVHQKVRRGPLNKAKEIVVFIQSGKN